MAATPIFITRSMARERRSSPVRWHGRKRFVLDASDRGAGLERHQVILYDQVGTGRSATIGAEARSIAGMADDIATVMDQRRRSILLMWSATPSAASSWHEAWRLRHPRRLLRSLVVVNGWGRADPFLRRCFEIRKQILNQSGPKAYVRAQPLFLYPPQWISSNIAHLEEEEERILAHFPPVVTMNQRIDMFLAFDGSASGWQSGRRADAASIREGRQPGARPIFSNKPRRGDSRRASARSRMGSPRLHRRDARCLQPVAFGILQVR